jgi:hypothetical protein
MITECECGEFTTADNMLCDECNDAHIERCKVIMRTVDSSTMGVSPFQKFMIERGINGKPGDSKDKPD